MIRCLALVLVVGCGSTWQGRARQTLATSASSLNATELGVSVALRHECGGLSSASATRDCFNEKGFSAVAEAVVIVDLTLRTLETMLDVATEPEWTAALETLRAAVANLHAALAAAHVPNAGGS